MSKMLDQFRRDLHGKAVRSMIAGESPDGARKFIAEQLLSFENEQRFTTNQLIEARVCAFRTVSSAVEKFAMEESINASGAIGGNEQNRETIKAFTEFLMELQSDPVVQAGALMVAAEMGEAGIVKWLLAQGAKADARDDRGFTPLIWAALKGQQNTVQVLLDADADVNAQDHDGWTATMWAASQGQVDALKMILSKIRDVNAVNNDGKTALAIATAMNQAAVVVVLKEAGAKE
jgi:FOG: Ankyrin repeat